MKMVYRYVAILLAVLMTVCMFSACGADNSTSDSGNQTQNSENVTDSGNESDDNVKGVSLEDAYNEVVSLGILPEMFILQDNYIETYYGISADAMEDKVFAIADDSLLADTVIVVKVSANASAADIESAFNAYNDQRKLELESYNPTQYARVCDALIKTGGDYVFYIISDDNDSVYNTLKGAL